MSRGEGGGRPPKYKTAEELQIKIDEYFLTGFKRTSFAKTPAPTISGLVSYLGFCNRQSFYDLEKQEKFSYTIKRARTRIEQVYEERLHGTTPTGAIFALKNFGWRDTPVTEQSSEHLFTSVLQALRAEHEKRDGVPYGPVTV